jgi:hypothetical protein
MTESCHVEKDRIEGDTIILHAPLHSNNCLLKNLIIVTSSGEKKYQIKKTKHGKFLMN